ncbi:hypothetical protein E2C01_054614 [Portunus trituberculatus]|uniref:Uncharacterized protein n=1 Tax=Portunus trituberculatus TaxID=210409 RepID=A0A5B7GT57_PORTR|nr:hypothetical protein [Portunus trituberculatus]
MLRRQAVVRNLLNTYSDRERQQLMSSPIGSHLFDVVEQRELESSQRSLVSQIAHGLASTAWGVRAKAGRAVGSRCLAPVAPPLVLPSPAPKESSVADLWAVGALARDAAEVPLLVVACLQQHWQEWENIGARE